MLERLIREMRARAGWEFPWFVARVSCHNPAGPSTPRDPGRSSGALPGGPGRRGPRYRYPDRRLPAESRDRGPHELQRPRGAWKNVGRESGGAAGWDALAGMS
jgi:hypothetical protein